MSLSCLLAVTMVMSGLSAGTVFPLQDTANAGGSSAQGATPAPAEAAQAEADKKKASGDAKKAPDEAKKTTPAAGRRKRTTRKAEATPAAEGEPRKIVVRHGGAREPSAQIVPDMPREEAIQQRQHAEEMLATAEDRLKLLGARTLGPPQQETVIQIRNYMEKARSALKDGDTQRGHTLALKAYLLADDLVKR